MCSKCRRLTVANMKKKLKELGLEIIGGQIVQRVIADETRGEAVLDPNRKTIVAKTVSEGVIDDAGVVVNNYRTTFEDKKLTHKGDIIVKLSAPYNAAIIDEEHEGMLVSSFCSIIRNVVEIDKGYLVAFLNSEIAQEQLKNSVAGTLMSVLSSGKLYDLEIPVPSKQKQEEIGILFYKIIKNRSLIKQLIELENEKLSCMIALAGAEENAN